MSEGEKRIPELRFDGFIDEWEQRKLSNLMDFSNGINAPKENYGKGRKMISVMDILSKKLISYDNIRNSVEVDSKTESNNKVESGDIVFVRSSEVRNEVGWAKCYLEKEFALYSGFTIRGKKKFDFDAFFVELSINGKTREQIESKAGGSTRFNVSQSILKSVIIWVPSLREQSKISEIFRQLDDTIALHKEKEKKLRVLKQCLLNVCFPNNEENTPFVRFANFNSSWEQRKLGEISESYSGGTPSVANQSYYGGSIPFIRSAEINSKTTEIFLTEEGLNNSSAKLVEEGDILYALYGATSGEVGISQINGAINQAILAIKPKIEYDLNFIMQWLRRQKKSIISTYLQGGQGNLSGAIVKNLILSAPIEYEEQQKIGSYFKKLDETIALYQQKVTQMEYLKNTLLNKMFI